MCGGGGMTKHPEYVETHVHIQSHLLLLRFCFIFQCYIFCCACVYILISIAAHVHEMVNSYQVIYTASLHRDVDRVMEAYMYEPTYAQLGMTYIHPIFTVLILNFHTLVLCIMQLGG